MSGLANYDKKQVIDLLSERLAFEREGVKLYDRILTKMGEEGNDRIMPMYDEMKQIRNEEKEHEEWLEEQIRNLGGTAHETTEMSSLVQRESVGIDQVVMNDAELPHLFHALLAAELVDNAGWDLLVAIADEAGDREMKKGFKRRLHEEEKHLLFVRQAVQTFALQKVTGADLRFPTRP